MLQQLCPVLVRQTWRNVLRTVNEASAEAWKTPVKKKRTGDIHVKTSAQNAANPLGMALESSEDDSVQCRAWNSRTDILEEHTSSRRMTLIGFGLWDFGSNFPKRASQTEKGMKESSIPRNSSSLFGTNPKTPASTTLCSSIKLEEFSISSAMDNQGVDSCQCGMRWMYSKYLGTDLVAFGSILYVCVFQVGLGSELDSLKACFNFD